MKTKDPKLRMALKLQLCLERREADPDRQLCRLIDGVMDHALLLGRQSQSLRQARQRGWASVANLAHDRLVDQFRQLQLSLNESANQIRAVSPLPRPTLRDLYGEVQQLSREFPEIELDLQAGVLVAVTDNIELKGIFLGSFKIELHLARLAKHLNSSVFEVTALDPHPAASNDTVTHPHVRDGEVCCGDAAVPIASALAEGRLVDAFLALNSVLHTYNAHSPFVNLNEWDGTPCSDCGGIFESDNSYMCNGCEQDFCDDCASTCEICDATHCRSCLEEDPETGRMCCRGCRETCQGCDRIVESDDFDSETNLCPQCLEKQRKEQLNPTDPTQSNPLQEQEIKDERHDDSRPANDGTGSASGNPTTQTIVAA